MRDLSLYLFEMQESQRKWAFENFGAQLPIQMMVGLLGELGEFAEHYELRDDSKIVDDIGDVGVYLMNYCNLKGWRLYEDLLRYMEPADERARYYPYNILPFVKSLPHHQLKGDQNIRGGTVYHDECMKKVLANLLWQLDQVAMQTKHTFVDCLAITWSKVSKRDWVLHPDDADVAAENKETSDV
jgi:NTP pyrophosphatase (non-canonical NTP hydrolase)